MNIILLSFWTIFLAELGDKTQIAIICMAALKHNPFLIWIGSTSAFMVLNFLAVLIGCNLSKFLPIYLVKYISGSIFIIIGILTFFKNS